MTARSILIGTTTFAVGACLAVVIAPVASASPAASGRPGLLTSAQVPGFTVSGVSRRAITHGSLASCDAFGPIGGTFSAETLSRGGRGAAPLDLINEVVVHTASATVAKTTIGGFRAYVTRCLANQDGGSNGIVASSTPVRYKIAAHALPALSGTKAGVEFTISATATLVSKGATVVTKLESLPILLYPAGSDVLLVLPDRNVYSVSGKANVATISEPAALAAIVGRALPLAVKDL